MPQLGKRSSRARQISLRDPDPEATSIVMRHVVAERATVHPLPSPVSVVDLEDEQHADIQEFESPPKRTRFAAPIEAVDRGAVGDYEAGEKVTGEENGVEPVSDGLARVRATCATIMADLTSAIDKLQDAMGASASE